MYTTRMNDISENKWFGYAGIAAVVWVLVVAFMSSSDYGISTINVFPDETKSKNYELKADVTIDKQYYVFFYTQKYSIEQFYWPNGGYERFEECRVSGLSTFVTCESASGDEYSMKLSDFESTKETESSN